MIARAAVLTDTPSPPTAPVSLGLVSPDDEPPLVLVDRRVEKQALDRLLGAARRGLSGALVLRGDPGVGKTALLEYAIRAGGDLRIARVDGVESEMELGFAALHQLLIPFMPHLDRLPAPQRGALRSAFGLAAGAPPDRFLVGLAVLTLLADAAAERPLLVVVDDAQWLDHASAEVLAFVARRLHADRLALILAVREPDERQVRWEGLPRLDLGGLPDAEARDLLASVVGGPLDLRVADRIIAEAAGNPLALTELPRELTPAQLAGGSPVPELLPLGDRLEEGYLRRIRALPEDTQTLLLLAAASPSGDAQLVRRAAKRLGIDDDAAGAAETDRLLLPGPQISFRHPLIRSAVFHGAPVARRRQIHEALAAASDPDLDADRRAWHLAAAAVGPDEAIAAELERSAERARARGGYAAAAAYLARAAELAPDAHRSAERKLAAAEAELTAGAPWRAEALVDQAAEHLDDQLRLAQAGRLRGAISFALGRGGDAPDVLLSAARALEPLDPRLARETLLEAFEAAHWAGSLTSGAGVIDVAREAHRGARPREPLAPAAYLLLDGLSELVTTGHPSGVPILRGAIAALAAEQLHPDAGFRWLGLGCYAAGELFDDEASQLLARRWVQLARERGALTALPMALAFLGGCEVLAGRFGTADASFAEGREISAATRNPGVVGETAPQWLLLLSWRGREQQARAVAAAITRQATESGKGKIVAFAHSAISVLELGLGNYDAALASAFSVYQEDPLCLGTQVLPDLIEAASRTGDRQTGGAALERLAERASASGNELALALLARSRALLAEDSAKEMLYREAIDRLKRLSTAPELARAHLLYGEWLRRQRRRRDARDELRIAHDMFEAIGADAFAARARVELLATGERARKRTSDTLDDLTAQEAQIAGLAAEGATNPDIAAQLFISPSTVAYHLRKVYRKLGVNSRNQLEEAEREREPAA